MATLKLQYSSFEEGEFTKEEPVELASFVAKFDAEANDKLTSKYSWTIRHGQFKYYITNRDEVFFLIEHISKDGYKLTFCDRSDRFLYTGNFYYKATRDLCEMFFKQEYLSLKERLELSEDKKDEFITSFKELDFVYPYRHTKVFDLFFGTLFLGISLLFLSADGANSFGLTLFQFILSAIFFTVFVMLVILHLNHLKESKNKSIKISSGCNEFQVTIEDRIYEFTKSDVEKVKVINSAGGRNPFSGYEYTQLIFKNNTILNISNMLISPELLESKFRGVKKETKITGYAFIKPKSCIVNYR